MNDTMTQLNVVTKSDLSQLQLLVSNVNSSLNGDVLDINTRIDDMPSSMVENWPDAIGCTVHGWGWAIFYLVHAPNTANNYFYYRMPAGSTTYSYRFNTDGSYAGDDNVATSDCESKSITELKDAGQTFTFLVSV